MSAAPEGATFAGPLLEPAGVVLVGRPQEAALGGRFLEATEVHWIALILGAAPWFARRTPVQVAGTAEVVVAAPATPQVIPPEVVAASATPEMVPPEVVPATPEVVPPEVVEALWT